MFKTTVFIVKKHWALTNSFEDTVRFIGEDLYVQILSEYWKLSESHKNVTCLSQNLVSLFITEVRWKMRQLRKWKNMKTILYY